MPIVRLLLTDSADRPLQSQTVKVQLIAPGNPFTSQPSAVIHIATVSTPRAGDDVGVFSVDLPPSSTYEHEGSYYRVDARDGIDNEDAVWAIRVPDAGGPYDLRDLIVVSPTTGQPFPPVPPHALEDHTDVDETVTPEDGQVLTMIDAEWTPFGNAVLVLPPEPAPIPDGLPAGVLLFRTT